MNLAYIQETVLTLTEIDGRRNDGFLELTNL